MVHLSLCQNYKQFRIVIYNSRGVLTVNCIDYDSRVINYDRSVLFKIDHTSSATFLFSKNCYARTRRKVARERSIKNLGNECTY